LQFATLVIFISCRKVKNVKKAACETTVNKSIIKITAAIFTNGLPTKKNNGTVLEFMARVTEKRC
jgi:hypothetical protein